MNYRDIYDELEFGDKDSFVKASYCSSLYDVFLDESQLYMKPLLKHKSFISVLEDSEMCNSRKGDIVRTMIDFQFDPSGCNKKGQTVLMLLVNSFNDCDIDLITDFVNIYGSCCNPDKKAKNGETAFHLACSCGNREGIANLLLDRINDVGECVEDGSAPMKTPIMWAIQNEYYETCSRMIDMFGEACIQHNQDGDDDTLLMMAIRTPSDEGDHDDNFKFIEKLIDTYGDKLRPDVSFNGETALIMACILERTQVAKKIVMTYGKKCLPRHEDSDGDTALILAVKYGMKDFIKFAISDEYTDLFFEN